jgi:type I restriction enzyme, S subunit
VGGNILWTTPKDLSDLDGAYIETPPRTITEEGLKSCAATLLPVNSVLLSSRAPIGLVAINTVPMATNQGFKSLVPDFRRVDSKFLFFWLKSRTSFLQGLGNGATFKEMSKAVVERIEIPLPPLEEQRQIASILDKADELRRKRRHAVDLLNRIKHSIFLEMFGDPVNNPKKLAKIALGDLIKVKSGNGLVAKDMALGGSFPVYGGNGINGHHDQFMFEHPKVVIGRVGVYCGVVHLTEPKSWVTDNALYVSEFKKPISILYLQNALIEANLNQYAGRAAQPLISGSRIYPIEILLPSKDAQVRFETAIKQLARLDDTIRAASLSTSILFSSLQSRAFSGQL